MCFYRQFYLECLKNQTVYVNEKCKQYFDSVINSICLNANEYCFYYIDEMNEEVIVDGVDGRMFLENDLYIKKIEVIEDENKDDNENKEETNEEEKEEEKDEEIKDEEVKDDEFVIVE